ncbi:unnamed protein product [Chrysoparadoxa australica]
MLSLVILALAALAQAAKPIGQLDAHSKPFGKLDAVDVGALASSSTPPTTSLASTKKDQSVLVGTLDGVVHGVDRRSGKKKWSISTGEPLIKSFQREAGKLDDSRRWLIPATDGSMLIHTSAGLGRLGPNVHQLLEQMPFMAPGGTFYAGSKNGRIFGVDVGSGEVLQVLSGASMDGLTEQRSMLGQQGNHENIAWVGRVDMTVRAFDVPTGLEQWNLTVSEFITVDGFDLSSHWGGDLGGLPTLTPSVATPEGLLTFSDAANSMELWEQPFEAPVAAVFELGCGKADGCSTARPMHRLPLLHQASDVTGPAGAGSVAIGSLPGDDKGQLFGIILSSPEGDDLRDEWEGMGTKRSSSRGADIHRTGSKREEVEVGASPVQAVGHHSHHRTSTSIGTGPRTCFQAGSEFPSCLKGIHIMAAAATVDDSLRLPLPGQDANTAIVEAGAESQGLRDWGWPQRGGSHGQLLSGRPGVRVEAGYVSRLPPLEAGQRNGRYNPDPADPSEGSNQGDSKYGRRGAGPTVLELLYKGWNLVSLGLLALAVAAVLDKGRAAKLHRLLELVVPKQDRPSQQGMGGYGQDPTDNGTFSNGSEASTGTAVPAQPAQGERDENGMLKVGCLSVSDVVLGYGSHGTVVYRGFLEGRPVAVKRMLKAFHARADREISLLIESDGHPNVVRYFVREEAGEFVYLALQLCQLSLHSAMAQLQRSAAAAADQTGGRKGSGSKATASAPLRGALLQVSKGVAHLHGLRIVHRDLKPHNILLQRQPGTQAAAALTSTEGLARFVLKISDMGLGKQLLQGQSSFGLASHGQQLGRGSMGKQRSTRDQSSAGGNVGSVGWQAPEVIEERIRLDGSGEAGTLGLGEGANANTAARTKLSSSRRTQAVDVFSLGCIFYHCIVPGGHPYGEWYEREANIVRDHAPCLAELQGIPDALDCIKLMTARDPCERPSVSEVCTHPFFWPEEKRLQFLLDFSDRLEQEGASGAGSALVLQVEAGASAVVGRSWDVRLDPGLLEEVGRYRTYDYGSVRDLLRLLRNKRHHLNELPERLQMLLSPLPGGLLAYMEERFPLLLMHCYHAASAVLACEAAFDSYIMEHARVAAMALASAASASENGSSATEEKRESALKNDKGEPPATGTATPEPKDATEAVLPEAVGNTGDLSQVLLWSGSTMATSLNCRGWWRHQDGWCKGQDKSKPRNRPPHLNRAIQDPRYRSRLCSHWDNSMGTFCPMKSRGKCDFAHSPLELRIRPKKRDCWGSPRAIEGSEGNTNASGGVDVLTEAR